MDIFIKNGDKVIISTSVFSLVFIGIILTIISIIVNNKVKKSNANEVPSGFMNVVEFYVETINGFVKDTMGSHNMKFAPFIFTLFTLLITSNLSGLVGLVPPTSNYSVTLALALVVFVTVQTVGIRTSGPGGYVKGFFEPIPLLSPLNIIGELANPVSLSFRLFGNILSGVLIMGLLSDFLSRAFFLFRVLVPPVLHLYFDVFSGILQAFIFTMLTMVFISGNTEE